MTGEQDSGRQEGDQQPVRGPIEAQREQMVAILQWIASLETSEPDWEERALEVRPSTDGVPFVLQEQSVRGIGGATGVLSEPVAEVLLALQQQMADPEKGAWVTGFFTVTSDGGGDARFNFDEEPRDPETGEPSMTAEDLRHHREQFPRTAEHTPGWMQRA